LLAPARITDRPVVILAHPDGRAAFLDDAGTPIGLARNFLQRQHPVLLLDTFLTGALANPETLQARKYFSSHFSTYNRTDLQERVQDLITACAFARTLGQGRQVILCGTGRAGLWAMLASPAADAVIADCASLDLSTDAPLMEQELFVPGIRRLGAFEGVASLAAPNPLLTHNTGSHFGVTWLLDTYATAQSGANFRQEEKPLNDEAVADWAAGLKLGRE